MSPLPLDHAIAGVLKAELDQSPLTLTDLAHAMGRAYSTTSLKLSRPNRYPLTVADLGNACRALGVSPLEVVRRAEAHRALARNVRSRAL